MRSKIMLCGHLGADPEKKTTATGTELVKLRVATKPRKKDGETNWWSVTAFKYNADFASKYLSKGDLVLIEGDVSLRKYTDREGQERLAVDVVADHIAGLGGRKDRAESREDRESIPF